MSSNDVVIRNTINEDFDLLDAQSHQHLAGPYHSFAAAVAVARSYTTGKVFQQILDNRGRVMGDPLLIHFASGRRPKNFLQGDGSDAVSGL